MKATTKAMIVNLLMIVDLAAILFVAMIFLFTSPAHAGVAKEKSRTLISTFETSTLTTWIYEIVYYGTSTFQPTAKTCILTITKQSSSGYVSTALQCNKDL